MLLKHVHYLQDVEGRTATLHYILDQEGAEVDLVLCRNNAPVLLAECRHADTSISRFMAGLAARFPKARAGTARARSQAGGEPAALPSFARRLARRARCLIADRS